LYADVNTVWVISEVVGRNSIRRRTCFVAFLLTVKSHLTVSSKLVVFPSFVEGDVNYSSPATDCIRIRTDTVTGRVCHAPVTAVMQPFPDS
jgi:hypothetical protein